MQKIYLGSCESLPFFFFFFNKTRGFCSVCENWVSWTSRGLSLCQQRAGALRLEGRAKGFFSSKEHFFFP